MLTTTLRYISLSFVLGISLPLVGCQQNQPTAQQPPVAPPPAAAPVTPTPGTAETASDRPSRRTKAEDTTENPDEMDDGNYGEVDETNTYRPRKNQFEVTLPEKYDAQPQKDGVAFLSPDGGFGGEVVFFKEEKPLDAKELEDKLKEIYEGLLGEVSWQFSEIQPDGSVRVDWRGTTPEGRELDAVSYIEQRDNMIFVLNVYGIDKPYDSYLDDSQTIIGSYLTMPEGAGEAGDSGNSAGDGAGDNAGDTGDGEADTATGSEETDAAATDGNEEATTEGGNGEEADNGEVDRIGEEVLNPDQG